MRLETIQVLRGLAALLVVLFHIAGVEMTAIIKSGSVELPRSSGIMLKGYAGVDLFFVISGFIMYYVTSAAPGGGRNAAAFLFARIGRVYPLWWVFATIVTLYMVIVHVILNIQGLSWGAIGANTDALPYLLKSYLLIPQFDFPVLNVGWTLVHEMYFYVIFGLLLLAPRKLWPVLFGIWAIAVIGGALAGFSAPTAKGLLSLATHPLTLEFMMGAGVAALVQTGRRWKPGIVTAIGALSLLAALCLHGSVTEFSMLWGRVLWFGLPAAIVVYGLASLEIEGRLAWLVPISLGVLIGGLLFQGYGYLEGTGFSARLGGTILALTVAIITMLVTFWTGWLMGQSMPDKLVGLYPVFGGIRRLFAHLGDWSYSLYLCHLLVILAMRYVFEGLARIFAGTPLAIPFDIGRMGSTDNLSFIIISIIASIVAARYTYEWIERPLIRWARGARVRIFGDADTELQPADTRAAIW